MENKSHAIAAGTFVMLMAALLVAMAVWLTRDTAEQREFLLSSREAVTGLQPQAGVRFRGVTVGKVMDIGFDPAVRGNVLIRIATNDAAPITRSTFATLGFQGVTGLAFIQLDDTGESKELLVPLADELARIPVRPSLLSKLSDQGASILGQLDETSRRLNLLLAPENQKVLITAVNNLGSAAAGIAQFSHNADKVLDAQFGPQRMNLPKLAEEFSTTLKTVQTSGDSIGASADEVKLAAKSLQTLSQSLNQPGGALDKLGEGAQALTQAGQTFNSGTLPRLNRATDQAARTAREFSRAANTVSDNPQSLLYGNGAPQPGPGEPGFAPPAVRP